MVYFRSTEASDGEFPPEPVSDDSETEADLTNISPEINTDNLVEKARNAGHLRSEGARSGGKPTSNSSSKSRSSDSLRKRKSLDTEEEESGSSFSSSKKKVQNSDIFPPSV